MQRTFNPWNRARYPGGPLHLRFGIYDLREATKSPAARKSSFVNRKWKSSAFNLPRGVTAACRVLTPTVLVRIQARQPSQFTIWDLRFTSRRPTNNGSRKSSFVNRKFSTPAGDCNSRSERLSWAPDLQGLGSPIASRLAYTQKSRGQNLPGRPFSLSIKNKHLSSRIAVADR
jgi:hypothetical protein